MAAESRMRVLSYWPLGDEAVEKRAMEPLERPVDGLARMA